MFKVTLLFMFASILTCQENMPENKVDTNLYEKRQHMVEKQIMARGVSDKRVLNAMRSVPREKFVPPDYRAQAYEDYPLAIGYDQTISQPYIVAYMTEVLDLDGSEKVLEIGTGSGYQAAVLGECAEQVYSIEIVEPLCERARNTLDALEYDNIHVRCGDGYAGWPEQAPFDAIMVTAAPPEIPQELVNQLAHGGRMVVPVGRFMQHLLLITKNAEGEIAEEKLLAVRFVPMIGGD